MQNFMNNPFFNELFCACHEPVLANHESFFTRASKLKRCRYVILRGED